MGNIQKFATGNPAQGQEFGTSEFQITTTGNKAFMPNQNAQMVYQQQIKIVADNLEKPNRLRKKGF